MKLHKSYPHDTNLLNLMFTIARNDKVLMEFLAQVQFIRDHPNITEQQVRASMAVEANRKPADER
jgi:hypothetical protein